MAFGWASLTVCILLVGVKAEDSKVVETLLGSVRGRLVYTDTPTDGAGVAYYGIPYATPPVGNLRFQPPQPAQAWEGVKDCTKRGKVCPQDLSMMEKVGEHFPFDVTPDNSTLSEDCLTMDIYAPAVPPQEAMAVMIWIHGGGLKVGSSDLYDGRYYAINHGVIFISIQYRLGILGFLYSGDDHAPGNLALLDQIEAFKWVRDNIHAFGGDPQKVTVAGESGGSWATSLHLVSPNSAGLFSGAILQSGSAGYSSGGMFQDANSALANAKTLAEYLECPTASSAEMVDCLQKLDMERFIFGLPEEYMMIIFSPITDGKVVPDDATTLFKTGQFSKDVTLMAGVCDTEGYLVGKEMIPYMLPDFDLESPSEETFEKAIEGFLNFTFAAESDEKRKKLTAAGMATYITGKEGDAMKRGLVDFLGDSMLLYPTYKTAESFKDHKKGDVYFYNFAYKLSSSNKPAYITADHGDELLFMFGDPQIVQSFDMLIKKDIFNEEDRRLAAQITSYWANFAKTKNPNGPGLPQWDALDEKGSYLNISSQSATATQFRPERVHFWSDTAEAILSQENTPHEEL